MLHPDTFQTAMHSVRPVDISLTVSRVFLPLTLVSLFPSSVPLSNNTSLLVVDDQPVIINTNGCQRRGWDSNPRYLAVNTLSKRARSATLTPLREKPANLIKFCASSATNFTAETQGRKGSAENHMDNSASDS